MNRKSRKSRCAATTRSGRPCPNMADKGKTLCHLHDPDGTFQQQWRQPRQRQRGGPTCSALTTKGRPCPWPALDGKTLCHVHDPDGTYQRQRRGEAPVPDPREPKRRRFFVVKYPGLVCQECGGAIEVGFPATAAGGAYEHWNAGDCVPVSAREAMKR